MTRQLTTRIMGLETEYAVSFTRDGQRRLAPDEAARAMFREVIRTSRSSNVFCDNGGRLYLDVGNHPEYATAECTDLHDLLNQDRAGELIMLGLARSAEEHLAGEQVPGTLHVLRNNIDSAGNSYGCHENYLVPRDSRLDDLSAALVPFLVTRQLTCGAGHVSGGAVPGLPAPAGTAEPGRFCLSQRSGVVWEGVSSASTRSRPMINSRDEPHADAQRYRRLHVIVGDSNMSQTSALLKVGSTELLLRYLEAGQPPPVPPLARVAAAIRAISADRHHQAGLAGGGSMSAVQIQRACFEAVAAFTERDGYPGRHDRQVLALWDRVLTALERDDLDALAGDVDWVIKLRLLERFAARTGAGFTDPRIGVLDLLYHDISPDRGLFRKLERAGAVSRVTSDASAREALTQAPPTRARVRAGFIRAARAAGRQYAADWSHLRLAGDIEALVTLTDPFESVNAHVEDLIGQLSRPGPPG